MPHFYERASRAISTEGKEYEDWVNGPGRRMLVSPGLCGGQSHPFTIGRFIQRHGFHHHGHSGRDIRKLLNKVMKKAAKWDAALVSRMRERYQAVNPLTHKQ